MDTASIRKKLHSYLEVADDKKVKAIYDIMENEIEASALKYTDEIKEDLDNRYAEYKSDTTKAVTAQESKERINKILKSTGSQKWVTIIYFI